jgi:ABC-type multidrug transport system ATPase subunit
VGKRFGERKVLSAATLHARPGVVTALAGRNGAGKSTLLRIMAGVMAPDHGVLRFRGRPYERTRLHRLAREGLFYLPVDRSTLTRTLTLREHLGAVRRRFGVEDAPCPAEALGIAHLLDRRPRGYSGGEHRRAELALALLRGPACLIADEPFLGLTPADMESVVGALRALAGAGAAVVLTGHEIPWLMAAADDVVWMTSGTTLPLGPPDAARRNETFRREYLGPGGA